MNYTSILAHHDSLHESFFTKEDLRTFWDIVVNKKEKHIRRRSKFSNIVPHNYFPFIEMDWQHEEDGFLCLWGSVAEDQRRLGHTCIEFEEVSFSDAVKPLPNDGYYDKAQYVKDLLFNPLYLTKKPDLSPEVLDLLGMNFTKRSYDGVMVDLFKCVSMAYVLHGLGLKKFFLLNIVSHSKKKMPKVYEAKKEMFPDPQKTFEWLVPKLKVLFIDYDAYTDALPGLRAYHESYVMECILTVKEERFGAYYANDIRKRSNEFLQTKLLLLESTYHDRIVNDSKNNCKAKALNLSNEKSSDMVFLPLNRALISSTSSPVLLPSILDIDGNGNGDSRNGDNGNNDGCENQDD